MVKLVSIFDFEFTVADSMEELADTISNFDFRSVENGVKTPFLITPNVDDIVNWDKKKFQFLKETFQKSIFVIPDGQPLVWFSKLIGRSLVQRTTGSTVFPLIWRKVKEQKKKVLFILANKELCDFYEQEYELACAYYPPFFHADDKDKILGIVSDCRKLITEQNPHFVFVGIQFPKQNIIARELYRNISVKDMPLFLILGSSMEYYSGTFKEIAKDFSDAGFRMVL